MKRSMDEILSNSPSVATEGPLSEPEPTPAVEPAPESDATPSPEPTKPEAKPATPAAPKADDETEQDEHVPDDLSGLKKALAAARGDKRKARSKWQEAERQLAELNGRVSAYRQIQQPAAPQAPAPKPAAPPPVDLTEDEWFTKGPEAVKQYIAAQLERERTTWQEQQMLRDQEAIRTQHADYDDVITALKAEATQNPTLRAQVEAQMARSPNPALVAYRFGKTFLQVRDIGAESIDDLREKIRAEERAKIESEIAAKQPTPQQPARPAIPKSIAGARGSGVGTPLAWSGPRPLDDILR